MLQKCDRRNGQFTAFFCNEWTSLEKQVQPIDIVYIGSFKLDAQNVNGIHKKNLLLFCFIFVVQRVLFHWSVSFTFCYDKQMLEL